MTDPYLIAHLVRGEPAFDIAIRCDDMGTESDPGPWWIIPTSGHRAYPYWWTETSLLSLRDDEPGNLLNLTNYPVPTNHRDHYAANDRHYMKEIEEDTLLAKETARPGTGLITNLADLLGFVAPKPTTITRR